MKGIVSIYKNDILVVKNDLNTIQNDLKSYLYQKMNVSSALDEAIDDLFTVDNEEFGDTQDGLDGIVIGRDNVVKTMITTTLSPSQSAAKKWRGKWTSDGSYTVEDFAIGFNLDSVATTNPTGAFATPYARYQPTTFAVENLDIVVIEWEIQVTNA